jgi:hypothetical protein
MGDIVLPIVNVVDLDEFPKTEQQTHHHDRKDHDPLEARIGHVLLRTVRKHGSTIL